MTLTVGCSENVKAVKASYKVSPLIAKTGKAHTIAETLIKPAANIMATAMVSEKATIAIYKVSLSNDTVKRRIITMADNVKQ